MAYRWLRRPRPTTATRTIATGLVLTSKKWHDIKFEDDMSQLRASKYGEAFSESTAVPSSSRSHLIIGHLQPFCRGGTHHLCLRTGCGETYDAAAVWHTNLCLRLHSRYVYRRAQSWTSPAKYSRSGHTNPLMRKFFKNIFWVALLL